MFFLVFLIAVLLDFWAFWELKKKKKLLSPLMFYYVMVSLELIGPLFYYIILNGDSYRSFTEDTLLHFSIIVIIILFLFNIQLRSKTTLSLDNRKRFLSTTKTKLLYHIYITIIILFVALIIFIYRNQLLLINVLLGNNENLVRSDTSGLIPHWYTISSIIICVVPSFYFYFLRKIKSKRIQFVLFLVVGLLTMIDGNKGLFIYLILFMYIYIYKGRINKYIIICVVSAFVFYAAFKAADVSQISIILDSGFRRFFVTQGACFINRISMIETGFDFSNSSRISSDVYTYMYHYSGGSAPTIFWGDIYVKFGIIAMIVSVIVTNWIMIYFSRVIESRSKNDYFVYWSYVIIAYMLCMSELSLDHMFRILLVIINLFVYKFTIGSIDSDKSITSNTMVS